MRSLPNKFLAAMIALKALPGAPKYNGNLTTVIDSALSDLNLYKKYKVDAIILENDNDVPYMKPPLSKETLDAFEKIATEIRRHFNNPIGIQIMEGARLESLRIAKNADLDFIRVEAYVFAHVGSGGIIEACSGQIMRERKNLDCEHIKVFSDVKKKHCSHSLTSDLDITDEIRQAEFSLVDGIIVTGKFTGQKPNTEDLKKAKTVTNLPVIIGSGMDKENIKDFIGLADGFIVGTTFRKNGNFFEDMEESRLKDFMNEFIKYRK